MAETYNNNSKGPKPTKLVICIDLSWHEISMSLKNLRKHSKLVANQISSPVVEEIKSYEFATNYTSENLTMASNEGVVCRNTRNQAYLPKWMINIQKWLDKPNHELWAYAPTVHWKYLRTNQDLSEYFGESKVRLIAGQDMLHYNIGHSIAEGASIKCYSREVRLINKILLKENAERVQLRPFDSIDNLKPIVTEQKRRNLSRYMDWESENESWTTKWGIDTKWNDPFEGMDLTTVAGTVLKDTESWETFSSGDSSSKLSENYASTKILKVLLPKIAKAYKHKQVEEYSSFVSTVENMISMSGLFIKHHIYLTSS